MACNLVGVQKALLKQSKEKLLVVSENISQIFLLLYKKYAVDITIFSAIVDANLQENIILSSNEF